MDQTFQQLGHLLFTSIPTILIFIGLHFYLKAVLYRPLRAVLAARSARIEGKLEAARQDAALAEQKLVLYEDQLRQARAAQYKMIEARRQQALAAGHVHLTEARHQAAHALANARQHMAAETAQARTHLQATAETVANQITAAVLGPANSMAAPLATPRMGA